jgi:hypothetical protein
MCLDVHPNFACAWTIVGRDNHFVTIFRHHHRIRFAVIDNGGFVVEKAMLTDNSATVVIWNNHSFVSERRGRDEQS